MIQNILNVDNCLQTGRIIVRYLNENFPGQYSFRRVQNERNARLQMGSGEYNLILITSLIIPGTRTQDKLYGDIGKQFRPGLRIANSGVDTGLPVVVSTTDFDLKPTLEEIGATVIDFHGLTSFDEIGKTIQRCLREC